MIKMTQTEENVREVELKTGNKIILKREDPFGFWYFHYERGPVPKQLTGAFTTVTLAERALTHFIESTAFEIGAKEEVPELQTKKVGPKAAAKAAELKEQDLGASSNAA